MGDAYPYHLDSSKKGMKQDVRRTPIPSRAHSRDNCGASSTSTCGVAWEAWPDASRHSPEVMMAPSLRRSWRRNSRNAAMY